MLDSQLDLYIDDLQITNDNNNKYLEFDIAAKSTPNGLKFGKADLSITYPTEVFGSNIVQSNMVDVQKEQIIQASTYSLNYSDEAENKFNILIDGSGTGGAFYSMSSVKEKLCHVKLTIQDFTSLLNVDVNRFDFEGDADYYCAGAFYPFREIILDDFTKLVNTNPEVAENITYTFENLHIIDGGSSLQIDIYATSSAPTSFAGGLVEFTFNTSALSFQTGNQFGFTRGEVIQAASIYPNSLLLTEAISSNTVRVRVESMPSQTTTLYQLDSNPHKLMSITLDIVDCNQQAGLDFVEGNMADESNHYVGGSPPYEIYMPVNADDVSNASICGCTDEPDMQEFSPTVIHAGLREVLTITGTDFGTYDPSSCKVSFENGDEGGGFLPPATAEVGDIISWSDTEIKVFVPSVTSGELFRRPACSGKIKVENDCGDDDFAEINNTNGNPELHIPYAVFNRRTDFAKAADLMTIADVHADGGYVFHYSKNVSPFLKTAFQQALDDWCAETDINFRISESDPKDDNGMDILTATPGDGFSTITVENISTGEGSLVVGTIYLKACVSESTGKVGWYMKELDIKIDNGVSNFDLARDVFLHELGHAHMLQHSENPNAFNVNSQYVMFHTVFGLTAPSTIKNDDATGGKEVYNISSRILSNSGCDVSPITTGNCGFIINTENVFQEQNISVLPNPNSGEFSVNINDNFNGSEYWKIQNPAGVEVLRGNIEAGNNIDVIINLERNMTAGIYTFSIVTEKGVKSQKIVVQ